MNVITDFLVSSTIELVVTESLNIACLVLFLNIEMKGVVILLVLVATVMAKDYSKMAQHINSLNAGWYVIFV